MAPPSGPNQVWQLDFGEFETRRGGTWRIGGVADYWLKLELGWHVATTANHRDAIETVEQAIAESERLIGRPLAELLTDPITAPGADVDQLRPLVDVGGEADRLEAGAVVGDQRDRADLAR